MASSNNSSPPPRSNKGVPPPPARSRFALAGRSVHLDPARFAVRKDLADVELADRVFAPHYAKALMAAATRDDVAILAAGQPDAAQLATLATGDVFRVLEITDDYAWGQAGAEGAVGFVDRHALSATGE